MADVVEFRQCDQRNYTQGRRGNSVRKVVVHYTGTGASAHNNLLYFSRSRAGASAHYFIGKDGDLRQSVPEKDTAWHAGNWTMNLQSVGIEVVSAGEDFTEAQIRTLAALVGELMSRYRLSPSDVIRHYDVTGKRCPAPYVDRAKWQTLHARITGQETDATQAAGTPYRVRVTVDALNVRKGPGTGYGIAGCIRDHGTYTIVEERSGWGRLRSGAGWISLTYTRRA